MWSGEDYLPFAEIKSLRNMVLTGEDDGDMSYMRLQERQLKPGKSNARALPPSQPPSDQYDESAVVPYHGARGQQDNRSHFDRGQPRQGPHYGDQDRQSGRNHDGYQYGESDRQSRRGGFRPTYD